MRNFSDKAGKRRTIVISNMKLEEAEDYSFLFCRQTKAEREKRKIDLEKRIKNSKEDEWILAIHTIEGKLIGKMEISSSDSVTAKLEIEMPNEVMAYHYGVESIKQFRKICKECNYFSSIELEVNKITERYKKYYGLESNVITLKNK